MEPTLSSETSAFILQTPEKFPKEHRLHKKIQLLFICKKKPPISTCFGSYIRATMSTTTHKHAVNTTLQLQSQRINNNAQNYPVVKSETSLVTYLLEFKMT